MLNKVKFVLIHWFMWIIFFFTARLLFLCFNLEAASNAGWKNNVGSFLQGARMDMSMAVYLMLPVLIFVILSNWITFFQRSKIYILFNAILLVVVLSLVVIDIGLFQSWNSRIDATFLRYISNPKEVWATISHLPIFLILVAVILVCIFWIWIFKKVTVRNIHLLYPSGIWLQFSLLILLAGLFIIPMRGGFQLAPMNQSTVFFSTNHFSNLAAINAPWNFMHDLLHKKDTKNPYIYMEKNEALGWKNELYPAIDFVDSVASNPNVLLIVWESLTSKVLNETYNGKTITPGLNELIKDGIFFSNAYANGDRTDKGIVGVLSGYPAQPTTSIVKIPAKAAKLPMISKDFKQLGYNTAYYYGGELEFANMKAYLMQGGFEKFVDVNDFEAHDKNSKWGAHDGVVAEKLFGDLINTSSPFFYTWLTLSSHEPFETPVSPVLDVNSDEGKFFNVMHYSDSIVYRFIQNCKQQSWWNNTLVIIVGDHGHPYPKTDFRANNFRIPMLFTGGFIRENRVVDNVVSQTDLAATLLSMIGMSSKEYNWSKNALHSEQQHAFFTFNNGFGFADSLGVYLFDNVGKQLIEEQGSVNEKQVNYGKALQQLTYQDYLDR